MSILAFDTETYMMRPGLKAPRLVVGSFCNEGGEPFLDLADRVPGTLGAPLRGGKTIVGFNLPFDLSVTAAHVFRAQGERAGAEFLRLVFDAYDRGAFRDARLREQLDAIAEGRLKSTSLSLAAAAKRRLDLDVAKGEDTWRTRYAELDGVPLERWPAEARDYAREDARLHRDVFLAQGGGAPIPDELPQLRADWALALMGTWGVRTDARQIAKVRAELDADLAKALTVAQATNLIRAKGTRDMKAIRAAVEAGAAAGGWSPELTDTGLVGTDEDQVERAAVSLGKDTPLGAALLAVSDYAHALKIQGYLDALEGGTTRALCVRWNNLVDTGRTSCSKDKATGEGLNLQNPPRKGGVRECIVPRPGFAFVSVDYDTLELRTLAQACIDLVGYSEMAKAINAGRDLHTDLAADILGISYEEAVARLAAKDGAVKDARQMAKVPNFGKPGGMGNDSLRRFAWQAYRVHLSAERTEWLSRRWLEKWPEMREFFRTVGALVGDDAADIELPRIGRITGRRRYCAACNLFFQGPAASGAKEALYRVSRECYARPDSPLYGSRPVMFIHDEIITEVPLDRLHAAAFRQAEIQCEAMQELTPDVTITASPAAMLRWYKDAEAVFDVNGKLIPWEPKK